MMVAGCDGGRGGAGRGGVGLGGTLGGGGRMYVVEMGVCWQGHNQGGVKYGRVW